MTAEPLKAGVCLLAAWFCAGPLGAPPAGAEAGLEDRVVTVVLTTLGLSAEFLIQPALAPDSPRWVTPPGIDESVRDVLRWDNLEAAGIASEITSGTLVLGMFATPFLSDHDYGDFLALTAQSLFITQLATTLVKLAAARQRPYARFETLESRGGDDNTSFFSGNAGRAFAVATTTAYLLSREQPERAPLWWSSAMALAAFASYLRIAADRHYATDVLVGAGIGVGIGYLVPALQYEHYYGAGDEAHSSSGLVVIPLVGGDSSAGLLLAGTF